MSNVTEQRMLSTMRRMAWSRAKGELESMLDTIYSVNDGSDKFINLSRVVKGFIQAVEDDGLQE